MLNRVIEMGRLTRDPELRYTQSQVPVVSFSIAVDRDYKDQSGDRRADFFEVTAWRSSAEFVSKYFSKGKMIIVEGKLRLDQYTTQEGEKRSKVYILADNVRFGDSKKSENDNRDPSDIDGPEPGEGSFQEIENEDGELPF